MSKEDYTKRLLPFIDVEKGEVETRKVFSIRSDIARSQSTGHTLQVDRLFCPDWVNVIALVEDRPDHLQLLCVRQWRFGQNAFSLEVPAGIIEKDETPQEAASRELLEETGYAPAETSALIPLGTTWPNPAFMNNQMHTFFISNAVWVCDPKPDLHEEIETLLVPLSEVPSAIAQGQIRNAMVLVAFLLWQNHQPQEPKLSFPGRMF